jgi:hypothetical protein
MSMRIRKQLGGGFLPGAKQEGRQPNHYSTSVICGPVILFCHKNLPHNRGG